MILKNGFMYVILDAVFLFLDNIYKLFILIDQR